MGGAVMSPGTVSQETRDGGAITGTSVDRPCLAKILGSDLANSPALPVFFLLAPGDMLATLSLYIPFTHLPSAAMATGVSASQSALLVSAIGVTNTLGRLTAGWMSDQPWSHPVILITTAISFSVPFLYLFSIAASFWLFLILLQLWVLDWHVGLCHSCGTHTPAWRSFTRTSFWSVDIFQRICCPRRSSSGRDGGGPLGGQRDGLSGGGRWDDSLQLVLHGVCYCQ